MGIGLGYMRPHVARLAIAVFAVAALALTSALTAAPAGASGSVAHASRRSTRVIVKTYKVVPKPQRTVHSTGYATYVFSAPAGHHILTATARILGAQRHAVAISGRAVTNQLTRYTVKLVFPGEQGNPGKLVVRLALV